MSHPTGIVISGAKGIYASRINGIFDASLDDIRSTVPLYKHRSDSSSRIIYDAAKCKWKVRCVDLDGKTVAKVLVKSGQTLTELAKDVAIVGDMMTMNWVVKDGIRREKYAPAPEIKLELSSS